jgi:hypothetical protein
MRYPPLFAAITVAATLVSGCASFENGQSVSNAGELKTRCGSFFVYDMCMTDARGDQRVDYIYFADSKEVFMYRPDVSLPGELPLHRCAMVMREDVVVHSSSLLYGEDLGLLEEMDVKRKLLLSYMAAKSDVDGCYGGDSRQGKAEAVQTYDFASDDFDWGED